MPPVVLLRFPVDTAVLYPMPERISTPCPFEQNLQKLTPTIRECMQDYQAMQAVMARDAQALGQFHAHQERLQKLGAPLTPEEYQRLQDETNVSLDIWEVVQTDCPAYRAQRLWPAQPGKAEAARARVIARLRPRLRHPHAARALRQLAAARHTSPRALLRTEIFPAAMLLVSAEATTPQRMRVGRDWAVNEHGKVEIASPAEGLPGHTFAWWWFSQVYAAATAIVLGKAYPRPITPPVPLAWCEEEALERLAAPKSPGARDSAMLTALLQADETAPEDQLHRLLTVASPRACELFRLVSQGLSIKEAASQIGMSRNTAYTHYRRTRQKFTR